MISLMMGLMMGLLGMGACTRLTTPDQTRPTAMAPTATVLVAPVMTPTRPAQATPAPPDTPPEPVQTLAPRLIPTLTPLPTLSPQDAETAFLQLIRDPACRLPCFMGVRPGQSHGGEASQSLAAMATGVMTWDDRQEVRPDGSAAKIIVYNYEFLIADYDIYLRIVVNALDLVQNIFIYHYSKSGQDQIKLDELLLEFGVPDDVNINTMGDYNLPNQLPFEIEVGYREEGMYYYRVAEAEKNGNAITACFTEPTSGVVRLSQPFTDDYAASFFNHRSRSLDFLPVEATLEMDREAFYVLYSVPGNSLCLTTVADLWKP